MYHGTGKKFLKRRITGTSTLLGLNLHQNLQIAPPKERGKMNRILKVSTQKRGGLKKQITCCGTRLNTEKET